VVVLYWAWGCLGIRHECSLTNCNHGVVPSPVRSVGTNTIAGSKLAKAMFGESMNLAPSYAMVA
jgi:hypothetical protein